MAWLENKGEYRSMPPLPTHAADRFCSSPDPYDAKPQKQGWWIRRHTGKLFFLLVLMLWASVLLPDTGVARQSWGRPRPPAPEQLAACFNDGVVLQQTTYRDFAVSKPARLTLHKAWWSTHAPVVGLTVVTGLNPSRLEQLETQCKSWRGPLSAAVYLVLPNPESSEQLTAASVAALQRAEDDVAAFHRRMEAEGACQLDLMLLYETVAEDVMKVLLPVNTMRNYALIQARTRLVAMVDVDLVVSASLLGWMQTPGNYELLAAGAAKRQVYVLPAFETAPNANMTAARELADAAARVPKGELEGMVQRGDVFQFALKLFRQGHNCTDYPKWFRATEPYEAEHRQGYEPWFIIDRMDNPWYDASFRGYGWNKVTQVENIDRHGFKFLVHPAGFLVHRQHERSTADQMWQNQKKSLEAAQRAGQVDASKPNNNLAGLTHRFRDRVVEEMAGDGYQPLVDGGVDRCVRTLPWWAGGGASVVSRQYTTVAKPVQLR